MSLELNDEKILELSTSNLVSPEILDALYDIEDELEQTRLKELLLIRAKELDIDRELANILKAYDKAKEKMEKHFALQRRLENQTIALSYGDNGSVLKTIDNFLLVLRNDPFFSGVQYNMLTQFPEIHESNKKRAWDDSDDSLARNYIETNYNLYAPNKLDDALRILFKERAYHPIKDVVESVVWDGTERISTLLIKWLKCEDTAYTREVSRLIFAGGIHRLYRPGCKFDDVPILIGTKQGEGKSTFVRWLAIYDDFFNEVNEFEGVRGIESIRGAWICELSELLALTKSKEVEAVKSYITRIEDVYRQPYDKWTSKLKRQCIFIGTTNKEKFLTDKTGNRRFYPVTVHQSGYALFENETEIKADILQCWAEAKAKYDAGTMSPVADLRILDQIRKKQEDAVEDDYRVGMIEAYLEMRSEVCILELWQRALKNEFSKPSKRDSNDIALILQSMEGWERQDKPKRTQEYGLQKVWVKPQSEYITFDESEYEELPFQ